jgi:hypothetical protein
MYRREVLLAAGGVISLAGCSNRTDTEPTEGTSPTAEATTTDPSTADSSTADRSTEEPTETDPPDTETRARATTEATRTPEAVVPESDALVVTESYPIDGTMVNLGVGGTVQNTGDTALISCRVVASGDVGDERFIGGAERARLDPGETWTWKVSFGQAADHKNADAVQNIAITTRAKPVE